MPVSVVSDWPGSSASATFFVVAQLQSSEIKSPVTVICLMTVPAAEREKRMGYMVVNALAFPAGDAD